MKIRNIIGTGIIGGILSTCAISCKKAPFKLAEKSQVPTEIVNKIDSFSKLSQNILTDSTYKMFGVDTVEITSKLAQNPDKYIQSLEKDSRKLNPKVKIGEHFENLMIPKRGGGFDLIPTIKSDYKPKYIQPKVVITSEEIYSRNGKDLYVPVKYYGKENPEAIPFKKKK